MIVHLKSDASHLEYLKGICFMTYVNLYPLFPKSLTLSTSLEFEMPAEKTSVSALP